MSTRAWLDAAADLGAEKVGMKVYDDGGKWRHALPIVTPEQRREATGFILRLRAQGAEVEDWAFRVREDGETVYYEPLAYQMALGGLTPKPERFVVGRGGDLVEVAA